MTDPRDKRIAAAAHKARKVDRVSVRQVQQSQGDAVQALHQIIGNARMREQQREHLLWGIGGGILAGCLLWSIHPGMVVTRCRRAGSRYLSAHGNFAS